MMNRKNDLQRSFIGALFTTLILSCADADAYYVHTSRGWVNSECPCKMCREYFARRSTVSQPRSIAPGRVDAGQQAATPPAAISSLLKKINPGKSDVFYDLGCGGGGVLIHVVRETGCRGVGIEVDPDRVAEARSRVAASGLHKSQCRVVEGDAREFIYTGATIVYIHQWSPLLEQLVSLIDEGVLVISYAHSIRGVMQRRVEIDSHVFYFYRKEWQSERAYQKCN